VWVAVIFAVAAAAGYAVYREGPSAIGGYDIALKVTAAPVVIPLSGDTAGFVKVTATVENRTSKTQTLNASAPCKVLRVMIAGSDDVIVHASDQNCDDLVMEAVLEPGKTLSETVEIAIAPERLKAGERYKMLVQFWGQNGVMILRGGE
jgi:pectin methylesterase-like acyl-CoA thioesterase